MSDFSEDEEEAGPTLGTYEGDRHPSTGARHGRGKATLRNGDTYEGEYVDGQRSGHGVYIFKASKAQYHGQYVSNKKQGNGTMYYPDGSKYEGSWVDDLRSGNGTYTYANGDVYSGEWVGGMREGRGVYTYADSGTKYEGTWSKGVRSGEGELQYENLKFVGGFTDDQPLGAGRFLFKAGYMQPGEFVMAGDQAEDEEEEAKPTTKWVGKPVMVAQ